LQDEGGQGANGAGHRVDQVAISGHDLVLGAVQDIAEACHRAEIAAGVDMAEVKVAIE
jgi:hypothetical protein